MERHLTNTKEQYGLVAIALHWSMAVMVIGLFLLGLYMGTLEYVDAWYTRAPHLHESFGLVVFALLLLRTFWTLINTSPEPVPMPAWEQMAAVAVQRLFYLLLFALTISGYLISTADGHAVDLFNWAQVPAVFEGIEHQEDIAGAFHVILAWVTIGTVSLHFLAAMKHHFVDHDVTLLRMLGRGSEKTGKETT
jgi:cytochrome b561